MFAIKVFCQWTKEVRTTWSEVWVVGQVRMKRRSSHLGFRSVSWFVCTAWGLALSCKSISSLFSDLGCYLQIESLSVCRTKYDNVVWMVSPGFWKWTVCTSWESHETVSIIWPVDRTTIVFGYKWTGMLPLHGFVFWFRSEVMDPWLITSNSPVECVFSLSLIVTEVFQSKAHSGHFVFRIHFSGNACFADFMKVLLVMHYAVG